MRNSDVVEAWYHGRHASTQHMMTDGDRLWSYALVIGFTDLEDEGGSKVLLDYTAPYSFVSMTTSCHVGMARHMADEVLEVEHW